MRWRMTPSAGARISDSRATVSDCLSTVCARATSARACSVWNCRKPSRTSCEPVAGHFRVRHRPFQVRAGGVRVALRSDFLGKQDLLALQLSSCEFDGGLLVGDVRLGLAISALRLPTFRSLKRASADWRPFASRSGAERRLPEVEAGDEVARLHAVALADLDLDDAAGDLRREVHDGRFEAAAQDDDVRVAAVPAGGRERRRESEQRRIGACAWAFSYSAAGAGAAPGFATCAGVESRAAAGRAARRPAGRRRRASRRRASRGA